MDETEKLDHDIKVLKETKALLTKIVERKKQRIQSLINHPQPVAKSWKDLVNNNASSGKKQNVYDLKFIENLLDIESHEINKTDDDKYSVKIKMSNLTLDITFSVETAKNGENNKIKSLSAKVTDIESWFISELQPCIIYCEENNDLQLLMFNISQYQQKLEERYTITNNLAKSKVLNLNYDKNEMTSFSICDNKKPKTVFCKVSWKLHFSKRSLSFVHRFNFEDGDEEGFIEENKDLLIAFNAKPNLAKLKTNFTALYSVISQTIE